MTDLTGYTYISCWIKLQRKVAKGELELLFSKDGKKTVASVKSRADYDKGWAKVNFRIPKAAQTKIHSIGVSYPSGVIKYAEADIIMSAIKGSLTLKVPKSLEVKDGKDRV